MIALILLTLVQEATTDSVFTVQPMNQNVLFGQMVTFHCAINISGYSLSFSASKENNEPQTVDTTGDASSAITGTFTLTQDNNGTRVRCSAVPDDDGTGLSSPAAFAYGQDVPEVANFIQNNQTDPCTIIVQWEEPFLLPGLSVSYTVSVYLENITVSVHNVSTTTFTYHPTTGSGVYTVQVRTYAFSGAQTSEAINTTVEFYTDEGVYIRYKKILSQRKGTTWIYQYDFENQCSISISNVTVTSCSRNTLICYTASTAYNNVTIIGEDIIITAMALPDSNIFSTTVSLEYESGQSFLYTEIETSTHNLQDLSIVNITSNTLCLQFTLVYGTTTHDVHIHLSSDTDAYHIHYSYKHVHASECFNGVPSNNWTLIACDSGNSNTCISNPAIILYNVHVPGAITTTSTVVLYTETQLQPSDTTSPQVTVYLTEQHNSTWQQLLILVVVVLLSMSAFIILLTINIIMLVVYCYKKKQRQSSSSPSMEVHAISPIADYDNFHPSTTTLQIQDCSAYGVVTSNK